MEIKLKVNYEPETDEQSDRIVTLTKSEKFEDIDIEHAIKEIEKAIKKGLEKVEITIKVK